MAQLKLTLVEHHGVEELKRRFLRCKHPVEKRHWQAIWLLARSDKESSTEDVARVLGCCADWVRKLARRYNREGEAGLADRRRGNHRPPLLDQGQRQKLSEQVASERPPDGGLWTGPKVGRWLSERAGRRVSAVTGWKYLGWLGFRLKVPRPRHRRAASEEEKAAFKKNFRRKSRRCGGKTPAKP